MEDVAKECQDEEMAVVLLILNTCGNAMSVRVLIIYNLSVDDVLE